MNKFDTMAAKNQLVAALKVMAAAESNLLSAGYDLKLKLTVALVNLEYPIAPVTFQSDFESMMGRLRAHAFTTEDIAILLERGEFKRLDGTFTLKCIGDKFEI